MVKKIFWGFDAYNDGLKANIFVGETLAVLNQKLNYEVQPVFTLGLDVKTYAPTLEPDAEEELSKVARERMGAVSERVKIPGILPIKVTFENSFSKTKIVKSFINYADKNGAALIALGSHGKTGLERAMLGSFCETLLLHCHLPVLVVGQNFSQVPRLDEILFPTDFSDDSFFAFHKALTLAAVLGARVTLFHHVTSLLDPVIQGALAPFGGGWAPRLEVENLKNLSAKLMADWVSSASEGKVMVRSFLDLSQTNSSDAIIAYANRNNIGLITMATQSGILATTLFGSVTRNVVRQARCPVWLLRH